MKQRSWILFSAIFILILASLISLLARTDILKSYGWAGVLDSSVLLLLGPWPVLCGILFISSVLILSFLTSSAMQPKGNPSWSVLIAATVFILIYPLCVIAGLLYER
jgi:hypothetical protein